MLWNGAKGRETHVVGVVALTPFAQVSATLISSNSMPDVGHLSSTSRLKDDHQSAGSEQVIAAGSV